MSGEDSPEVEITRHIDISQVEEVADATLSEEEHMQRDFDDAQLDLIELEDEDDELYDFLDEDAIVEHTHEDEHYNEECEKGYKEKEENLKGIIQVFDPKDLDI